MQGSLAASLACSQDNYNQHLKTYPLSVMMYHCFVPSLNGSFHWSMKDGIDDWRTDSIFQCKDLNSTTRLTEGP